MGKQSFWRVTSSVPLGEDEDGKRGKKRNQMIQQGVGGCRHQRLGHSVPDRASGEKKG